jgi:hypothetical protein
MMGGRGWSSKIGTGRSLKLLRESEIEISFLNDGEALKKRECWKVRCVKKQAVTLLQSYFWADRRRLSRAVCVFHSALCFTPTYFLGPPPLDFLSLGSVLLRYTTLGERARDINLMPSIDYVPLYSARHQPLGKW